MANFINIPCGLRIFCIFILFNGVLYFLPVDQVCIYVHIHLFFLCTYFSMSPFLSVNNGYALTAVASQRKKETLDLFISTCIDGSDHIISSDFSFIQIHNIHPFLLISQHLLTLCHKIWLAQPCCQALLTINQYSQVILTCQQFFVLFLTKHQD